MWYLCFWLSIGSFILMTGAAFYLHNSKKAQKRKVYLLNWLFAGVFAASFCLFLPVYMTAAPAEFMHWRALLLSVFHTLQVFALGCDYGIIAEGIAVCPDQIASAYQLWAACLFVLAPVLTFSFVLSLFKNISANFNYLKAYFRDVYAFSELNEKSLTLAADIKENHKKAAIIFTNVHNNDGENNSEQMEAAKQIGAICFTKDIAAVDFQKHSGKKAVSFFAISEDETQNLNQALKLVARYRHRANTNLYVFSTKLESELLLNAVDKGFIKVRRINAVKSLINRVLYEQGELFFRGETTAQDGRKYISAVVVGMGQYGVEMVKALTWFGQMDGYKLEIHAFDKDPLAEEKFKALVPELMSPQYNGVEIAGEAQYKISVHAGIDTQTISFAQEIAKLSNTTYVLVALGSDDENINAAFQLRMYFERMHIHPVIQAIVYNSQQKNALLGVKNYRGQAYDISFIGDMDSSYTEGVILNSELETEALRRHMKWGKEEEFWTYEYNYRSSIASAIHRKARIQQGIAGAGKKESELTDEERSIIEVLEHRRWNAYMRSEGYVYSKSQDPASRNDLAKMHHDLVEYEKLDDAEKRKDSQVGTQ